MNRISFVGFFLAGWTLLLGAGLGGVFPAQAAAPRPAWADSGMVVSAHPLASQAGLDILQAGGNAVDAAVATAFALGVVEGYSSGIGGGSFTLVHLANRWETVVVDGREEAPGAATADMYVDKATGQVNPELSQVGVLAGAVPGHVAALALLLDRYGTMTLGQVIEPSIVLADSGFELSQTYARILAFHADKLKRFPSSFDIFFHPDSTPLGLGERLVQHDLAETYRQLADEGETAFYQGAIADQIAAALQADHGLITKKDLEAYRPRIRRPVLGSYRGYTIYSMPPPSSGGVHLIQMLNLLERYDLRYLGHNSSESIHLLAEVMKRAFADRAVYMGDPGFTDVPVTGLLAKPYADSLARSINRFRAGRISGPGDPKPYMVPTGSAARGQHTTHLSVMDRWGNLVAMTATINTGFGSGYVIPGTGILLNNEMDDFSAQPGVENYFGLVGGDANAIAPGKRPLSSMTPTLVFYQGRPFMVLGSPGGPRIITAVLQTLLNVIDHGMDVQAAVDAPRIHHQWKPDRIYLEDGIPADVIENLVAKGHDVAPGGVWSAVEAILIDLQTGLLYGGSDSRTEGAAKGY
ncbi:MAG: gamma-glutamyltransferase [Candidatus Zixiibacteriota bacterium]|nr:MAG: gamma-glutamyltransferase [candidate division Zixibacteria bacterium]